MSALSQTRFEPAASPRWSRSGWSIVLLMALVLLPPALIRERSAPLSFDDSHLQALIRQQPDYLFIGSSSMMSRIDPVEVRRLTSREGYLLGELGTQSALWYLWLKNSLIASRITPKRVFVLFRETELTNPVDETTSLVNQEKIARNRRPDDHHFDAILSHHTTLIDRFRAGLRDLYPIQETWRKAGVWLLDSVGFLFAEPGYPAYLWDRRFHPERVTQARIEAFWQARVAFKARMAGALFHSGNQRVLAVAPDAGSSSDSVREDFPARVSHSFLPEMIRLAQAASLSLVFVRLDNMPNLDGSPRYVSPRSAAYLADLKAYLAQAQVGFHDFDEDPAFRWEHYLDSGHIKPEFKPFYTDHFVKTLAEHFR